MYVEKFIQSQIKNELELMKVFVIVSFDLISGQNSIRDALNHL